LTGSDQDLLRQAAEGNGDSLARLVEEHGLIVRRQVATEIPQKWQSVLSVDDVMQQTYTDAFVDAHRFSSDGGSLTAWLLSLARYNLIDALRMLEADKRGGGRRRLSLSANESLIALWETIGGSHTTPSGHAAKNEARAALENSIEKLPESYRRVVQLYDLEGQSMDEVAKALDKNSGAVYMMRTRALRKLRALLGSDSKYFSRS